MDPSLIGEYQKHPEVKYMIDKIDECREELTKQGIPLSQPFQAPQQPYQMQFKMNH